MRLLEDSKIDEVCKYLIMKLAPKAITDDADDIKIAGFIAKFRKETNVNSLRLLLCIGIDVKTSIKIFNTDDVVKNTVIKSLRECIKIADDLKINLKSSPNGFPLALSLKFGNAQQQISPLKCEPCISITQKANYSRVSTFRKYMLYVVGINSSVNPTSFTKIEPNPESMKEYEEAFTRGEYTKINICNLGYNNNWVFVADKDEIKKIGYTNTRDIIDLLGLYKKDAVNNNGTRYVCLEYDSDFEEVTFQPNSFTADWGNSWGGVLKDGNDFYLSFYKFDGYGRTYPISGVDENIQGVKERTHLPLINSKKIYKMHGEDLKILLNNIERNKSEEEGEYNQKMLDHAYTRYSNS